MSSPAASNTGGGDRKKPAEQITFRFCSECSNMLYPKEDEVDRKLMFTCRTCNFSEEATSTCIFRNAMNNAAGETAGVTQDVGSDPTVGGVSSSFCCRFVGEEGDDDVAAPRRGSGSSGRSAASSLGSSGLSAVSSVSSASSAASSAGVSACLGCGTVLACETCGDTFEMRHPDDGQTTPELELDVPGVMGFEHDDADTDMGDLDDLDVDLDDVEIVPWTGESLDELSALVSRTDDFFGLRDMDLGMDEQAKTILGSTLSPSVTTALSHG